ncbi:hypothetical protein [Alkalihalobacillus sp. TS-13]|uniref:hypothetical protein n=1 Tax=Alkalihalobacillus sp. TS-13 TaxID=2842455 RepID=UPI001C88C5E3|nr:hypothetical protein [Alkalihalobacillus sp. TS-13]
MDHILPNPIRSDSPSRITVVNITVIIDTTTRWRLCQFAVMDVALFTVDDDSIFFILATQVAGFSHFQFSISQRLVFLFVIMLAHT